MITLGTLPNPARVTFAGGDRTSTIEWGFHYCSSECCCTFSPATTESLLHPSTEFFARQRTTARELEHRERRVRTIHLHFPTASIAGTKMLSSRVLLHSLPLCLSQALYKSDRHCVDTHTKKRVVEWNVCNVTQVIKLLCARSHDSTTAVLYSNECLSDPLDCPPLIDQPPPLPRDEHESAP